MPENQNWPKTLYAIGENPKIAKNGYLWCKIQHKFSAQARPFVELKSLRSLHSWKIL